MMHKLKMLFPIFLHTISHHVQEGTMQTLVPQLLAGHDMPRHGTRIPPQTNLDILVQDNKTSKVAFDHHFKLLVDQFLTPLYGAQSDDIVFFNKLPQIFK